VATGFVVPYDGVIDGTGLADDGRALAFRFGLCGTQPTAGIYTVGGPWNGTPLAPAPDAVHSCDSRVAHNNGTGWLMGLRPGSVMAIPRGERGLSLA
jgi:hypothetical protein